jgi:hypothetical protein
MAMRAESSYGWLVAADPDQRAMLAADVAQLFETHGRAPGLPDGPQQFADFETELLVGRYVSNPQPAFARLPFDYRLVPSPVRVLGLAVLDRLHSGAADTGYPAWPHERRLDDLRAELWADAAARAGLRLEIPAYPGGRRGAVLLTHDIDSRADISGISEIRTLERRYGLPSSVGFIPQISWPESAVIDELIADGCEVYCHDMRHDGKLAYKTGAAVRADFERFFREHSEARPQLRGFRSGQLLMTSGLFGSLGDWFGYDLSLPDTEKGGPYGSRAGCATVYPFLVDDLLEIPLTMPQDFFLLNVEHLDSAGMLSVWRDKLEAVLSRGGVAVVNTHPVWTNPKRAGVWAAYEGLLEMIAGATAWVTTPSPLREWLLRRRDGLYEPASTHLT